MADTPARVIFSGPHDLRRVLGLLGRESGLLISK